MNYEFMTLLFIFYYFFDAEIRSQSEQQQTIRTFYCIFHLITSEHPCVVLVTQPNRMHVNVMHCQQ